jgi:uncharacterized membrane-anchored protein
MLFTQRTFLLILTQTMKFPSSSLKPFFGLGVIAFFATIGAGQLSGDNKRPKDRAQAETLVSTLKFQQGSINIRDGLASLKLPKEMRFLDGRDASIVLVKLWGNPPQPDPLGMIVPKDCNLLGDCWAVVVTYEEDGYVKDDDAEKINYEELLKQMQKDLAAANGQRQKQGYPTIELVGWAAPPRYDGANHKLYWAKNLKFAGAPENTLNYNIRALGRRGVLVLNAVAGMSQLKEIENQTPKILSAVEFNEGSRYADFNASAGNKVAVYGLAALVAGGFAAKVGMFKGIWIALLTAKKFIIIGVAAVGA